MNSISSIRFMNSRFLGVSYIFLLIACLILSGQKLVPDVGVLSMQIMMVMISLFYQLVRKQLEAVFYS